MILAALSDYYEKLEAAEKVASIGYASAPISYALVIDNNGDLVDVEDLRDTSTKKPRPRSFIVPQQGTRTSGIAPNIFWDKSSYVLGASLTSKRFKEEHDAFVNLHLELLKKSNDLGLQALSAFLNSWELESFESNPLLQSLRETLRSEERRVGKECRSRLLT